MCCKSDTESLGGGDGTSVETVECNGVKTHCLLRAAASLIQDEDKGSEGGRRRRGDWQESPISGGLGLEVVCERDQ